MQVFVTLSTEHSPQGCHAEAPGHRRRYRWCWRWGQGCSLGRGSEGRGRSSLLVPAPPSRSAPPCVLAPPAPSRPCGSDPRAACERSRRSPPPLPRPARDRRPLHHWGSHQPCTHRPCSGCPPHSGASLSLPCSFPLCGFHSCNSFVCRSYSCSYRYGNLCRHLSPLCRLFRRRNVGLSQAAELQSLCWR